MRPIQVRHTHGMLPRSAATEGGLCHSRVMAATLQRAQREVSVRQHLGLPVHEEIVQGALTYGPWKKEVVVQARQLGRCLILSA